MAAAVGRCKDSTTHVASFSRNTTVTLHDRAGREHSGNPALKWPRNIGKVKIARAPAIIEVWQSVKDEVAYRSVGNSGWYNG
jgi:hypothetical protein